MSLCYKFISQLKTHAQALSSRAENAPASPEYRTPLRATLWRKISGMLCREGFGDTQRRSHIPTTVPAGAIAQSILRQRWLQCQKMPELDHKRVAPHSAVVLIFCLVFTKKCSKFAKHDALYSTVFWKFSAIATIFSIYEIALCLKD